MIEVEAIPGRLGGDHLLSTARIDRTAELGDVESQGGSVVALATPQCVDETIRRHHLRGVRGEQGQQLTLLRRVDLDARP